MKCLLERTILQSEGNSVLIIGPRGCGKTWVSRVWCDVHTKYVFYLKWYVLSCMNVTVQVLQRAFYELDNSKQCKNNYIKVYLNGKSIACLMH